MATYAYDDFRIEFEPEHEGRYPVRARSPHGTRVVGEFVVPDGVDTERARRLVASFGADAEHELVTLRATADAPRPEVGSVQLEDGGADPSAARVEQHRIWSDGAMVDADVYDRSLLLAGNVVTGPAVITEMDSTTLVLRDHAATVHPSGSLLIRPVDQSQEG